MKLAMLQLPERLPDVDPFPSQSFKTCAVVGNSGSLLENEFGPEIDEHDAVFRFNAARIVGERPSSGSPSPCLRQSRLPCTQAC